MTRAQAVAWLSCLIALAVAPWIETAAGKPADPATDTATVVDKFSSPLEQFASADLIAVGKVKAVEDKVVWLPSETAKNKRLWSVATLRLHDFVKAPLALKEKQELRVAFPRAPRLGQEGLFFLVHQEGELPFVLPTGYDAVIPRNDNGAFDRQRRFFERLARLQANPMTGLESKDAKERLLTAALILTQYRHDERVAWQGGLREVAGQIDPKQSRLILETVANADWQDQYPLGFWLSPRALFDKIVGAGTLRDHTPKELRELQGEKLEAAAKKWLRESSMTYRIMARVFYGC
jgi:hypothetical protein